MRKIITAISSHFNDDNSLDRHTASYVNFLASKLLIEEVINFHVFTSKTLYQSLADHGEQTGTVLLERISETINNDLDKIYTRVPVAHSDVATGNLISELMRKSDEIDSDLIVVGKSNAGHGTVAKDIIRHIAGNTLVVPQDAPLTLKHILVPVDLSEHAVKVLKAAINIKRQLGDEVKLTCLHAFEMPNFPLHVLISSEDQFLKSFYENKQKAFDNFLLGQLGDDASYIEQVVMEEFSDRPSKYILEYIDENEVDFVVLGTTGHSGFDAFFGSTTERVITKSKKAPLLIIK